MNNIFICEICKKQCKSHGTGFHLKYYHNITFKEYYDLYLKKENEGFCLECGKPTKFQDGKHGYRQFCSLKCSNKSELTQNKKENTCLLHYGVKYPSKNSDIREKQKETCRLHYGVNTPSESAIIREKQKETYFKNNGVYFPMQSKEIQEKSKNTCLANYNVEHPLQNNNIKLKFKETCLNNLGVENPSFSENIIKNVLILIKYKNYIQLLKSICFPFEFYIVFTKDCIFNIIHQQESIFQFRFFDSRE